MAKKKMLGGVDRGRTQPAKAGDAGAVMSAGFKKGSDKSAPRHTKGPKVSEYSPRYQQAAGKIHRLLGG